MKGAKVHGRSADGARCYSEAPDASVPCALLLQSSPASPLPSGAVLANLKMKQQEELLQRNRRLPTSGPGTPFFDARYGQKRTQ